MSFAELAQAVVSGTVNGSLWGLLAIGFGLIIGVSGRFHFAYATTFVLAIYVTVEAGSHGVSLYISALLAILAAAALGVFIEAVLYRPLVARAGDSALLAVFVTALGVVTIGENVIRLIWGSRTVTIPTWFTISRISLGGGVGLTNFDVLIVVVGLTIAIVIWAFLRYAKQGRALRAVQENPDMAQAVGVHPELVYLAVFAVGSALSAVGAILLTQRGSGAPDAGVQPTFTALVAIFLAGLRSSPLRFFASGLVIGIIQSLAVIWIGSLWSSVVTFGVLFVYIAVTPFIERYGVTFQAIRGVGRRATEAA